MSPRPSSLSVVVITAALLSVTGPRVEAQVRDPLRGLVADLRLVTTSLPSGGGWTPVLPTGGLVPSRGFGGSFDAQTFFGPGRGRRLGVGLTSLWVQGRSSDATTGTTVTTRLMTAGPELSANFGHRLGWSYLSAGAAVAKVSSFAAGTSNPGGAGLAIHYGFGARWFVKDRIGLSMDLRFWALTPRGATATRPNAPATTNVALGVGVAVH